MTLLHFLIVLLLYSQNHMKYNIMSVHARSSETVSSNEDLSPNNGTVCPSVWYKYNPTTHDCQCIALSSLFCDGEHAYADVRHIFTYDSDKGMISKFRMRHKYLKGYNYTVTTNGILLPNNISELNRYMCGPLNREDYMCKECNDGYGPAVIYQSVSCSSMCYLCKDTWKNLLIYLALNFIPLTVFYLVILVFQVRLTSAPVRCFIMYSQLVVLGFYVECGLELENTSLGKIKFTDTDGTLRSGTKILLILYGVFNLDFLHYVLPPFCLSSQLRPIHTFSLGYVSAFFPFLLILLTWFCIELHGRNFRPIVCLWRPFHRCFVRLRSGWNTKSDLIDVFASFFLLSYCKLLYQIMLTFDSAEITNYFLSDGHESHNYILTSDFSITIFDTNYILLTCCSVILLLFFIVFPILLLFFYPTKAFQKLLSKCCSNRLRIFLYLFIEKFHCCYKDGLDGTKDMRSFSGIYFLLRIIIYCAKGMTKVTFNFNTPLVQGFIFSVTALLIALSRPYKKIYMNIAESMLLLHVATLCYIIESMACSSNRPRHYLPMVQIYISLPFMVVFVWTLCRLAQCGILRQLQRLLICLRSIVEVKLCGSFIHQTQQIANYGAIN